MADKSLLQFQTGIGAAAHATPDKEQLILCSRVAIVDNISSVQDCEGELPRFMTFWTMAHTKGLWTQLKFEHIFNYASRHCSEVWA